MPDAGFRRFFVPAAGSTLVSIDKIKKSPAAAVIRQSCASVLMQFLEIYKNREIGY